MHSGSKRLQTVAAANCANDGNQTMRCEPPIARVGEKLHQSYGWQLIKWGETKTRSGLIIPVANMNKSLSKRS